MKRNVELLGFDSNCETKVCLNVAKTLITKTFNYCTFHIHPFPALMKRRKLVKSLKPSPLITLNISLSPMKLLVL